ncbi:MAG TPA: hypothetical protein VHD56_15215 [Tepidisphaeraceae bacterium]|nr:hypothetical protein [Tepidisphaeraceae bacterium]
MEMTIDKQDKPQLSKQAQRWLVKLGKQWLAESQHPELALLRARETYEQRGYSRQWIDHRLRGLSARQELTAAWNRLGAAGEDYRNLTNELFKSAFGMDVESYRRYKGLTDDHDHLRDFMTDLELSLVSLAETTAAVFHRDRPGEGIDKLLADVKDAGAVVAGTIREIEARSGRPVRAGKPLGQPAQAPVVPVKAA